MTATTHSKGLAQLREAFPPHQLGLLPKPVKRDDQDKGKCEQGTRYSADGKYCGGYHSRSIHLDYLGHAALTDRFLTVDPEWSWEPVSFGPDGLPAFDKLGGLWIRLTICGVTRLGYGDAQGKTGNNAVKEAIGDALRNAGMRFGAALDLWHKGDLHDATQETAQPPAPGVVFVDPAPYRALIDAAGTTTELAQVGSQLSGAGLADDDLAELRKAYTERAHELAEAA